MQADRAYRLLNALATEAPFDGTSDEVGELVQQGAAERLTADQVAPLQESRRQLDQVAGRLRELRRQLDLSVGPKVNPKTLGLVGSKDPVREELVARTREFEGLSQATAILTTIQSDGAGGFVRLSPEGRRTVAKLSIWKDRYAGQELSAFMTALTAADRALVAAVARAVIINRLVGQIPSGVTVPNPMMAFADDDDGGMYAAQTEADQSLRRGLSLLLARHEAEPVALYDQFATLYNSLAGGASYRDSLVIAGVLSVGPFDPGAAFERWRWMLGQVVPALEDAPAPGGGFVPSSPEGSDHPTAAAVLSDLPATVDPWIVERARQVASVTPGARALARATLTRSPYPVAAVQSRYLAALPAVQQLGYPSEGTGSADAAAALLAASNQPVEQFAPRLAALDERLREIIASPVAVALLAATPVAPAEAWDIFQSAVAAITRASFFSATSEIDYLALLLAQEPSPYLPATLPAVPPSAGLLPPPLSATVVGAATYHRVVYPHYVLWTAAHPVHFHAVPVFG